MQWLIIIIITIQLFCLYSCINNYDSNIATYNNYYYSIMAKGMDSGGQLPGSRFSSSFLFSSCVTFSKFLSFLLCKSGNNNHSTNLVG